MDLADGAFAADSGRAGWAAHACELYLLIIPRAAAWPAADHPLAGEALAHVAAAVRGDRPSSRCHRRSRTLRACWAPGVLGTRGAPGASRQGCRGATSASLFLEWTPQGGADVESVPRRNRR